MVERLGHRKWWPADTPLEVCVGAILTQNTNWGNVRRAIQNLKEGVGLDARKLFGLPEARLAELIRPAGYFNVKARRLRSFLRVLVEEFDADLNRLFAGDTAVVRERLLDIHGIGPETADSMLLYAGGHHSFVIDAYTQRIFQRHGWMPKPSRQNGKKRSNYEALKELCEGALNHKPMEERLDYWQDFHAQLVGVGHKFCRSRQPLCDMCPLRPLLP